jgi:hypothetical protein
LQASKSVVFRRQHLLQRGLPTTRARQNPKVTLIGSLDRESAAGITATRLWAVMRRFFLKAAEAVERDSPALAEKLGKEGRRCS